MSKLTIEDREGIKAIIHTLSKPIQWWDDWLAIDSTLSSLSTEAAVRAALATVVAFTLKTPGAGSILVMLLHTWDIEQWLDPNWETQFRWRLNFLSTQGLESLSERKAKALQFSPQIMRWSAAIHADNLECVIAEAKRFTDVSGGLGHHALRVLGLHALKNDDPDAAIEYFFSGIAKEADDVLLHFGYFNDLEHQLLRWFTLSEDELARSRALRRAVSQTPEF